MDIRLEIVIAITIIITSLVFCKLIIICKRSGDIAACLLNQPDERSLKLALSVLTLKVITLNLYANRFKSNRIADYSIFNKSNKYVFDYTFKLRVIAEECLNIISAVFASDIYSIHHKNKLFLLHECLISIIDYIYLLSSNFQTQKLEDHLFMLELESLIEATAKAVRLSKDLQAAYNNSLAS